MKEYSSGGVIKLKWEEIEAGSVSISYYVEWEPADLSGRNNKSEIVDGGVEIDNLKGNTWHIFKIRAVNEAGMGEYSEELRIMSSG